MKVAYKGVALLFPANLAPNTSSPERPAGAARLTWPTSTTGSARHPRRGRVNWGSRPSLGALAAARLPAPERLRRPSRSPAVPLLNRRLLRLAVRVRPSYTGHRPGGRRWGG